MITRITCAWLLVATTCHAAVTIGPESALQVPQSALYSMVVNNQPGNGDACNINPPIFSWTASQDPRWWPATDSYIHTYRFTISLNSDLSDPFFDLVVSNNCWNYLAPMSTNVPIYWRIGYIRPDTGATNFGSTNWFTITNAVSWDRSAMTNYVSYRTNKWFHPRMLLNDATLAGASNAAVANPEWWRTENAGTNAVTNVWWTYHCETNAVSAWTETVGRDAGRAFLLWALQHNLTVSNGNPGKMLSDMATNFVYQQWTNDEPVYGGFAPQYLHSMALGYDWCYPIMTASERSNVVYAIECWLYWARNYVWHSLSGTDNVSHYGGLKIWGQSHPTEVWNVAIPVALAIEPESAIAQYWVDLGFSYQLARQNPYRIKSAINQGRGYDSYATICGEIEWTMDLCYPEFAFRTNSQMRSVMDWWMRQTPVGFKEHAHDAWGDNFALNYQRANRARILSHYLWDGEWALYHTNHVALIGALTEYDITRFATLPYYYPSIPPTNSTIKARVFREDGWAIANSVAPNSTASFTNAVGIVFQARPRGPELNHSTLSDGSFECWAYGAMVSDAGSGNYGKDNLEQNGLWIDGFGVANPQSPAESYYSYLIGWTNTSDFTYMAADLTRSFARSNFTMGGESIEVPTTYNSAPSKHLSKAQRHIVFVREKYWVIYDDFTATNAATFAVNWHVYENTLLADTNAMLYSYSTTNFYGQGTVSNWVRHVVTSNSTDMIVMSGAQSKTNPFVMTDTSQNNDSTSVVWVHNTSPATNFHFMWVVYPQKWGATMPTITPIDDFTVAVTNDAEVDIVSFNTNTAGATLYIDLEGITGAAAQDNPDPPVTTPAPVLDPTSCTFTNSVEVSITATNPIYWSVGSATYTNYSAVAVTNTFTNTTTLYAKASNDVSGLSVAASGTYTLYSAPSVTNSPSGSATAVRATVGTIRGP